MESESNNQMDRLLRRQGRNGDRVPVVTNGDGAGGAHLDADELNAFAANELPSAARIRYVNHLADCGHCRHQIAELASAANPSLASAAGALSAAPASASIWQRIAGWIKPPTLKYAGPIMAVLCVAAIMGVVLRSQYGNRMLNEQQPVKIPTTGTGGGGRAPSPAPEVSSPGPVAPAPAPPVGGGTPAPAPTSAPSEAPGDVPTVAKPKAQDKTDASSGEEAKVTTRTGSGQTPEIVPPVTLGNTSAPAKGGDPGRPITEQPQQERDNESGGSVAQTTPSRTENRINVPQSFPPPPANSPTGGVGNANERQGQVMSKRRGSTEGTASTQATNRTPEPRKQQPSDRESNRRRDDDNVTVDGKDESQVDGRLSNGPAPVTTRTVANHVFRRTNGVWVDSGYAAGYAITNVARGTEQFRALVADEPGLGTIANQLSGDILVVWKGRAYRIR